MASAPSDEETDSQPEKETGATGGPSGGTGDPHAQGPPNVTNVHVSSVSVGITNVQANSFNVLGPAVILGCGYPYRLRHYPRSSATRDEALRPTTPPEDLSYLFRPEDLARGLEERLFVPIAMSFEHEQCNWRWFGRKLAIDTAVFNHLSMQYSDNIRELVHKMLVAYQRKYPLNTMGDVVKALCDSRNQIPVKALKKYFDEQGKE